ncbi:MAG: sigma-54-dependent Fis family transcriptional regulator [Proteobacteria bacterium]|nr:sigma-54-dependent Fis family transcriptional regulator [Pseudomonadota bacterium]
MSHVEAFRVVLGDEPLPPPSRREGGWIAGDVTIDHRPPQRTHLDHVRQPRQRERTAFARHNLIVRDEAMQDVVRRAEKFAWSEATVLIEGESGTGKEVLARYIHSHSRRAGKPFVAVNCAAIPEQLLESELFGHERGAFSGAVERRIGKFEAASSGTLLLDEISEMDVRLQTKLLRALQEREIDRLGGGAPVQVDVRVIATTNRDLWAEVARRAFREDLFFRLNVAPLHVPSLQRRPADIAALIDYFCKKYAAENGCQAPVVTTAAHAKLLSYSWPGNVRELENVIHRAVVMGEGKAIDEKCVDLYWRAYPRALNSEPVSSGRYVAQSLTHVERNLILSTLEHTHGNRTLAASILGISTRGLRNKLRAYAAAGIAVPAPASPGAH